MTSILFFSHYIFDPWDYAYLTHYILKHTFIPPIYKYLIYLIYSLIPLIVMLKVNFTFCFHNNFLVQVQIQYLPLLRKELNFRAKSYQTVNQLRNLKNLILEHRALEILLKTYLDLMGILLIPGYVITLAGSLFSNLTLIRQWSKLDPVSKSILFVISMGCQITWILALHASSRLTLFSTRTIQSWKSKPAGVMMNNKWGSAWNRKYMSKFQKSCRPFKIGYKSHFTFKRNSLLTYLKALYRGTFRALCALQT